MKQTICDYCQQPIPEGDERAIDLLKEKYPGYDICPDCDAALGKIAALNREKPEKILQLWFSDYRI